MRVNEIFYSLQGEGKWTGHPAVFVRLSGCNMHCHFCDTAHEAFSEMSADEIVDEVDKFPSRHVVITGGEPTMQLTDEFVRALKGRGKFVQIETNGSLPLQPGVEGSIDWITCSPKGCPVKLSRVDELKVVYESPGQDLAQYDELAHRFGAVRFLQPCDWGDEMRNRITTDGAIAYVKAHPEWALSLQTHKLLDIR